MGHLEHSGKTIRMARRTSFGPNYVLEAYLRGPIDAKTGLLINLIDIDKILKIVVAEEKTEASPRILVNRLYDNINQRLPSVFPGIQLSLDKVRLTVSEDSVWEYGK